MRRRAAGRGSWYLVLTMALMGIGLELGSGDGECGLWRRTLELEGAGD